MSDKPRQFARLKTRQQAKLSFSNGETIACEVSDFCQKGFNLQPSDQNIATDIAANHAHDEIVEIEFEGDKGKPHHSLRGKLTHKSNTDFGFYLSDEMPAAIMQSMIQARSRIPRQGIEENALFPEESQAILRDCVNLFRIFLGQAWQSLLTDVKNRIAERDTSHLPLTDHSRYLNGLTDLQIRVEDISRQHFNMLIDRMHKIGELEENTAPRGSDELSIIDESSFDDWLNISSIFNLIDADNRPAIFQFAQRLSRLTPTPIGPHNDPFGPQAVCLTFQEAVSGLDFNNAMRAILYRQFGNILANAYAHFYDNLNRLLAPLKPVQTQREKSIGKPASRNETGGSDQTINRPELVTGTSQNQAQVAQQVSKLAEIAERLFTLYPPLAAAPDRLPEAVAVDMRPADSGNPVTPSGESTILNGGNPDPNLTSQLRQLQQILGHVRGSHADSPLPDIVVGTSHASANSNQLDSLLTRLGASQTAMPDSTLSDRISQALALPESAAQLPQPVREDLGMMSSLLGHAMAEHGGQSDIDKLLKKLEKPIYDLALRGEAPTRLENHPLGRLINLVDRFSIVADDSGRFHDTQLRDLVESIIDKGLSQLDQDTNSLETTCTALEKLLKYPARIRKQRVVSYQEICEAKGRIRDSNQLVVIELNNRLGGRVAPKAVTRLLEQGWQHRFVLIKLRDDVAEWDHAWRILDSLMAQPGSHADALSKTEKSQLLDDIQTRLEMVSIDRQQLDKLMQELTVYLNTPDQAERVQIPEGWFKLADSPADSTLPQDRSLNEQLRIGDWWVIEHEGKPVPMQLIWLSQPPGHTCFVNRSADRKQDLTLNELTTLLGREAAKTGEDRDLPLLERSEYGTIDAMYRRLVQQANRDPVTNLPNRKFLIQEAGRGAQLNNVNSFCVLSFEPFRMIFDHCGAQAGETLARTLAAMAERSLSTNDRLAVIGEGRFAVFLPGQAIEAARELTIRLNRNFTGFRFQQGGESFNIQVVFGLASYQPGVIEAAEALRQAVSACDAARSLGPGTAQVYADSNSMIQDRETMDTWAGQISEMLSGDRLFLRCQKIAPLQTTDALPYYEVLLGVIDDSGSQTNPQPFVLAVERWRRAYELDLWVFNGVMEWIRRNRSDFDRIGGFSVNLSAQSLSSQELLSKLHRELSVGDLPCDKIIFEITETATLQSHAIAQDFMRQIRRYGCRFSLDDFGSGNASFGYLRNLRTDTLKIDGAYIKDLVDDPELQAMVKSMNEIGHALGMKTVAEFVASPEILALVREMGIDYAQGYEIEKPIRINELIRSS